MPREVLSDPSRVLLQEGEPPSKAPKWALVWHLEMDCLRRYICWQGERLYWEGALGGGQQGKGAQEDCRVTSLEVSGFMVMRLVSGFPLANHLTQNPSWWHMHCSAKMDASEKDSGRWSDTPCLLLTFPEFFRLLVACFVFLARTSCCKITHANGYHGAWPGWVVSIKVSSNIRLRKSFLC